MPLLGADSQQKGKRSLAVPEEDRVRISLPRYTGSSVVDARVSTNASPRLQLSCLIRNLQ
jgi:hypothetical protein